MSKAARRRRRVGVQWARLRGSGCETSRGRMRSGRSQHKHGLDLRRFSHTLRVDTLCRESFMNVAFILMRILEQSIDDYPASSGCSPRRFGVVLIVDAPRRELLLNVHTHRRHRVYVRDAQLHVTFCSCAQLHLAMCASSAS